MNQNLFEEYKSLRGEIGRNAQISNTILMANVAITASIIGYGLTNLTGAIFLSPFAVMIPSMFLLASQLEGTIKIATYIMVFLEPALDIRWESRLFAFKFSDRTTSGTFLRGGLKYPASISAMYCLMYATCMLLALVKRDTSDDKIVIAAVAITVVFVLGIRSLSRAFSKKYFLDCKEKWEKVRDSENS